MLHPDKIPAALCAIHRLLVYARFEVGNGMPADQVYKILDAAEILPTLVLEQAEDTTPMFQSVLESLGEEFPRFAGLANEFSRNVTIREPAGK